MLVSELFERLSYGELSNLYVGDDGAGSIPIGKHAAVINHVNEGLLRLFSRMQIKTDELIIEQTDYIVNYVLDEKNTETFYQAATVEARAALDPFIKDMARPYRNDALRILKVFDQCGNERRLNDVDCAWSYFTPSPKTLQIPHPLLGEAVSVLYQARHPKLTAADLDQEIDLPEFLEGALSAFVGYRFYSHMNGQENIAKSQEFLGTYEAICLETETRDLVNQTASSSHNKFRQRGFV